MLRYMPINVRVKIDLDTDSEPQIRSVMDSEWV